MHAVLRIEPRASQALCTTSEPYLSSVRSVLNSFPRGCDKTPGRSNLREEEFLWLVVQADAVLHGGKARHLATLMVGVELLMLLHLSRPGSRELGLEGCPTSNP